MEKCIAALYFSDSAFWLTQTRTWTHHSVYPSEDDIRASAAIGIGHYESNQIENQRRLESPSMVVSLILLLQFVHRNCRLNIGHSNICLPSHHTWYCHFWGNIFITIIDRLPTFVGELFDSIKVVFACRVLFIWIHPNQNRKSQTARLLRLTRMLINYWSYQ